MMQRLAGAKQDMDFREFHEEVCERGFPDQRPVDVSHLRPITFAVPGKGHYTYRADRGAISVTKGDRDADTLVELDDGDWRDFISETRTSFALLYAGALRFRRGSFPQLSLWEPVIRSAVDGQDVYDLDNPPPVVDAEGRPLDFRRSFSMESPDGELSGFLRAAGFIHLRAVFGDSEIDALRREADAALSRARPDDRRSWWTQVDGREVCNRVNYVNDTSALVAGIGADPRMERIGTLAGLPLQEAADRLDGHSLVLKVPGASSGLADLPWHRDCGMGGHPVKCPLLNVGIQLDAATEANGQLQLVAGSHRGTSRLPTPREVERLPVVSLDTEPGDVTVHFGHTLHAAPPPTDPSTTGRRALYVTFVSPLTFEIVGPGLGYNDVLFGADEGRIRHVDELDH